MNKILALKKQGYTIHTFGQNKVMSGAFIIFICGDKGRRVLAKETSLMFHRGRKDVELSFKLKEDTKLEQQLELNDLTKIQLNLRKINILTIDLISKETAISSSLFYELENTYFNSEKALELGVADKIENTLFTLKEFRIFTKYFIEHGEVPFEIPHNLELKIKLHYSNYKKYLLTEDEVKEFCLMYL